MYRHIFSGAIEWNEARIKQLHVLKEIAFKIIAFISQFENELVKIWNKSKFVLNSNYVITLDRIAEKEGGVTLVERLLSHKNFEAQVKEWRQQGIVDESFDADEILLPPPSPFAQSDLFSLAKKRNLITTGFHLPYNPKLVERSRELRKNMTPAEKKLWHGYLRRFKYPVLRQRPIDQYIADFYCAELKLVIEIDGESHFTEEGKIYDEERTRILEGYGLRILRFSNKEVLEKFNGICQVIEEIPPSPLSKGGQGGLKPRYQHLPIDTKHFKDVELEILSLLTKSTPC